MSVLPKLDDVLKDQGIIAEGISARMTELQKIQLSGLEHENGKGQGQSREV